MIDFGECASDDLVLGARRLAVLAASDVHNFLGRWTLTLICMVGMREETTQNAMEMY